MSKPRAGGAGQVCVEQCSVGASDDPTGRVWRTVSRPVQYTVNRPVQSEHRAAPAVSEPESVALTSF